MKIQNYRHFTIIAFLLLLCSLSSCNLYCVEDAEIIQAPEANGEIVIPDWDEKQTE